jgi:hypothetical protein
VIKVFSVFAWDTNLIQKDIFLAPLGGNGVGRKQTIIALFVF